MFVDGNEITHCKREGRIYDMIITNCKQGQK